MRSSTSWIRAIGPNRMRSFHPSSPELCGHYVDGGKKLEEAVPIQPEANASPGGDLRDRQDGGKSAGGDIPLPPLHFA